MITIQTTVHAPMDKVWTYWTDPQHIVQWNFATDDWYCPHAENDLRVGGKLKATMAAKDRSRSFDFVGTYTDIEKHKRIEFALEDGRHVSIVFNETPDAVRIVESFDAEQENTEEVQRAGWQAILDNFKKHVEAN